MAIRIPSFLKVSDRHGTMSTIYHLLYSQSLNALKSVEVAVGISHPAQHHARKLHCCNATSFRLYVLSVIITGFLSIRFWKWILSDEEFASWTLAELSFNSCGEGRVLWDGSELWTYHRPLFGCVYPLMADLAYPIPEGVKTK